MTETVTRPEAKKETEVIRYLIHERLKARLATTSVSLATHLDEDAIGAFVEGRLEEAESSSVISHLIACAPCRQTTAQLIRLESQFDATESTALEESPGPLSVFLEGLASRLAPSFEEDAVFAYQEPESDHGPEVVTESKPETVDEGD